METQKIEMREAIRQAIDEEMALDEKVFVLGEEVGHYNGAYKITKGLLEKYGEKRVIDSPIAEASFSGMCIGAALTGLRPIVEFMSFNFSFLAFDQIISNAAKMHYMSGGRFSVPIVFRGANGAAAQVSCQHSHCVEAAYSNFPGLIIMAPSNAYDAKGLLKSALRCNNPVLFLESELLYADVMEIPSNEYTIPIGKATVRREGADVTLISHSRMVRVCEKAADMLSERGISAEIIDLRTIKPLDIETIGSSISKTHFAVIVEEGHFFAGIASEVAFEIQEAFFDELDSPVGRVCQKETPMPYSKVLEHETLPHVESIVAQVMKTVSR
jgi:pyruvate dehydrogenase E1 component beta subunit